MKKRFVYGLLLFGLGLNLFVGAQIYLYSAHAAEKETLRQHRAVHARARDGSQGLCGW